MKTGRNILIADDDEHAIKSLENLIQNEWEDCIFYTVKNGKGARQLYRINKPLYAAFLDKCMPDEGDFPEHSTGLRLAKDFSMDDPQLPLVIISNDFGSRNIDLYRTAYANFPKIRFLAKGDGQGLMEILHDISNCCLSRS